MATLKDFIIVSDLDNTICSLKKPEETYSDVLVKKDYVDVLNSLQSDGVCVIIESSRNMLTQHNDEAKVLKNVGLETLKWLEDNNVKYDGIKFGKSLGTCYIDDKALRPKEFLKIYNSLDDKSPEILEKAIKKYLEEN